LTPTAKAARKAAKNCLISAINASHSGAENDILKSHENAMPKPTGSQGGEHHERIARDVAGGATGQDPQKSGGAKAGDAGRSKGDGPRASPDPEFLQKGLAKAERKVAGTRDDNPISAGSKELAAWRESGKIPTNTQNPARHLGEGGEHRVELGEDGARVIKHTKSGIFGFQPDVNSTGNIIHRPSKASEYMQRQEMQNKVFDTDMKLKGSHAEEGGGLTFSQTHVSGEEPSVPQIHAYMEAHGFKNSPANIHSRVLEHTTFFNPATNLVAGDAKPENFRKTGDGTLHVLDLMVAPAAPGTPLHAALTGKPSRTLAMPARSADRA
jgi:hypothetical protein